MADIQLDNQSVPSTPASGKSIIYVDSTTKKLSIINDAGVVDTMDNIPNRSVTSQTPFATDLYLAGSNVAVPPTSALKIGSLYRCTFDIAKTAAGTAAPVINVRFGTAGTTADTARLTFTFPAQTAAIDVGMVDIYALFRVVGASAVLQGRALLVHTGGATGLTGLSINPSPTLQVTSGAFDSTVANSIIGISVNGGASAAWTVQLVEAEIANV